MAQRAFAVNEDRSMKAHHAKTLAFVLTAFIALSPSSFALGQAQLPGMEPLEGFPAKQDNELDLGEAITSFVKGLLTMDRAIFNEGVRQVEKDSKDNGYNNENGYNESSSQKKIEEATKALRLCKDSCEILENLCRASADTKSHSADTKSDSADTDRRFEVLVATSCKVSGGKCLIQCSQNLQSAVSEISDLPGGGKGKGNEDQANEDQALEQQREKAVIGILNKDVRDAEPVLQKGIHDLQDVAFEELLRITLDDYKEYGVPEGETQIVTADSNQQKCLTGVMQENAECHDGVARQEDPPFFWGSLTCAFVSGLKALDCAVETVTRVCPFCPSF
jgi:hypothetical protein